MLSTGMAESMLGTPECTVDRVVESFLTRVGAGAAAGAGAGTSGAGAMTTLAATTLAAMMRFSSFSLGDDEDFPQNECRFFVFELVLLVRWGAAAAPALMAIC